MTLSPLSPASLPLLLLFAFVLAEGCADERTPPAARVAVVGGVVLTDDDVAALSGASGGQSLDQLVETALLAEGARARGLDVGVVKARADQARRQVLAQALLDDASAKATTEAALRERYAAAQEAATLAKRRVHVAHIVVRKQQPGADTKIAAVLARLRAGEKFDGVARALSEDPATAPRGGELAPIDEGRTDAAFFDAAARLRMGETSGVVDTPFGMHVIHALADPQLVVPPFEEARSALHAQALREATRALVDTLAREIAVERSAGSLRAP